METFLLWLERNYLRASLTLVAVYALTISAALWQSVHAATLDGTAATPTSYVDGTPLPMSSIKNIEIEAGTCSSTSPATFGTKEGGTTIVPPATAYTMTVPRSFGAFCLRARTVTTLGTVGDWTAAVLRTIAEPKPNPPLLTVSTLAYELRGYANGTFRMVQVGIVPLGAPCGQPLAAGYALFDGATINKPTTGGAITARCSGG